MEEQRERINCMSARGAMLTTSTEEEEDDALIERQMRLEASFCFRALTRLTSF